MGGGALMTPALVFLGIPPLTAVSSDLVSSAVTKAIGAVEHWRQGSPNLRLAKWLVMGSVPTAFAGAFIIRAVGGEGDAVQTFVRTALGATLLLTAVTYTLRLAIQLRETVRANGKERDPNPPVRPLPTLLVGMIGGLLVGLTSVGSGSLMMVSLLLLYPGMLAARMVGTDLVQSIPLMVAASASHLLVGEVDWGVVIPLIVGGIPGTYVGARIAVRVSEGIVRRGIVIVLSLTALKLLDVPDLVTIAAGVLLVTVGPLVWGLVRRAHGLPMFAGRDGAGLSSRNL
ncbi:MAG: TSUP family transporter [Propionibacteriales bacterium]|nr:TSUP family transporter [Propionibacteriales bacterium]